MLYNSKHDLIKLRQNQLIQEHEFVISLHSWLDNKLFAILLNQLLNFDKDFSWKYFFLTGVKIWLSSIRLIAYIYYKIIITFVEN